MYIQLRKSKFSTIDLYTYAFNIQQTGYVVMRAHYNKNSKKKLETAIQTKRAVVPFLPVKLNSNFLIFLHTFMHIT